MAVFMVAAASPREGLAAVKSRSRWFRIFGLGYGCAEWTISLGGKHVTTVIHTEETGGSGGVFNSQWSL